MIRYQFNLTLVHWIVVKHMLNYLRKTRNHLVFHRDELIPIGYTNLDFQFDKDCHRLISSFVFILGGATVSWRGVKQSCIVDSNMKLHMLQLLKL